MELLVDQRRRQPRCKRLGQRLELGRERLEPLGVQAVVTSNALDQTRIGCRDHRGPLVRGSERHQFLRVFGELDLQLRVDGEQLIPRWCWLPALHDGAKLRPRISREHPGSLAREHLRREGWPPPRDGYRQRRLEGERGRRLLEPDIPARGCDPGDRRPRSRTNELELPLRLHPKPSELDPDPRLDTLEPARRLPWQQLRLIYHRPRV